MIKSTRQNLLTVLLGGGGLLTERIAQGIRSVIKILHIQKTLKQTYLIGRLVVLFCGSGRRAKSPEPDLLAVGRGGRGASSARRKRSRYKAFEKPSYLININFCDIATNLLVCWIVE